ncbi:MAG: S49 family peptidase, partial [Candidatus Limnocylindrales bacterium]
GEVYDARLPQERGHLRAAHAWVDPDGDPDLKGSYRFKHHLVAEDGTVGAAVEKFCSTDIGVLNGGRAGTTIPGADKQGVWEHEAAHLRDGHKDEPGYEPPPLKGEEEAPAAEPGAANLVSPRAYAHVSKLVNERPWAVQSGVLRFMADLLRFRAEGGALTVAEIDERLAAAKAQNGERPGGVQMGSVAVLPMYGVISQRMSLMSDMSGGTSIDELRGALRGALNDPSVSAIVFDIDSPGGSVDGMPEFASELRQARQGRKPIVGQVNTLAASAAYWLGAQMSELVVTPSGEVGSIGVFAIHEDDTAALEKQGVKMSLISAGPFKAEGIYEPLSDVARAAIQDQVDELYGMFLADVARGRRTNIDNVATNYGQGRTLLARKALAAGMVDRIDTLETTVARLQPKPAGSRVAIGTLPHPAAVAASASRPDRAWNKRMTHKKGSLR